MITVTSDSGIITATVATNNNNANYDITSNNDKQTVTILATLYPFSHFCEIDSSLLSLQEQPNTAPNIFQRGVEYGKYVFVVLVLVVFKCVVIIVLLCICS